MHAAPRSPSPQSEHPLEILDPERGYAMTVHDSASAEQAVLLCAPGPAEEALLEWAKRCTEWDYLGATRSARHWIEARSEARVAVLDRHGSELLQATFGGSTTLDMKIEIARVMGAHAVRRGDYSSIKGETLAAGAVQYLCQTGGIDAAAKLLATILRPSRSNYLTMINDAVALKRAGPVPQYLEQLLGADGNYFAGKFCGEPFRVFEVTPTGNAFICCPTYLPMPVGNVKHGTSDQIINSDMAVRIRKSILDGSFGYCNWVKCKSIKNRRLEAVEEARQDSRYREHIARGDGRIAGPKHLLLSYDSTCNLWCPSCRTERIAAKGAEFDEIMRVTDEVVRPLLETTETVMMNGYGDIFSSRSCRRILKTISPETHPGLKLRLITNGVLLTETEWNQFPNIHRMVESIRVSIDAFQPETYAVLRPGGDFEKLKRNLQFISRLRRQGLISDFRISFVVQRRNFREMVDFCRWGIELGCDAAILEVIQNWGTYGDRFSDEAVHLPTHQLYAEYLAEVEKVENIKRSRRDDDRWNVTSDFAFTA